MNRSRIRWRMEDARGRTVLAPIRRAADFWGRGRGWMARRWPEEAGLWLTPCGSIHTGFMRFPLDAYFLDQEQRVVRIRRNVRPWRLAFGGRGAVSVLETRTGALPADAVREGDRVRLVPEGRPVN